MKRLHTLRPPWHTKAKPAPDLSANWRLLCWLYLFAALTLIIIGVAL